MKKENLRYDFIIGVDQSLSNTGVCVLDIKNSKVCELVEIKAKATKPDFENHTEYFKLQRSRVYGIVEALMTLCHRYQAKSGTKGILVSLENLATGSVSGRAQNKDTEFLLGYLFSTIMDFLDAHGYDRVIVAPNTHKKAFFPTAGGKKEQLYKEHWDDSFLLTGYACDLEFKSLDQKDAFCLAYFGSLMFSSSLDEIFSYRPVKARKVGIGKFLEAIKGQVCADWKRSKLCWKCPIYLSCTDKKKYKLPKTKKDRKVFDKLSTNRDNSVYNLFVNTQDINESENADGKEKKETNKDS